MIDALYSGYLEVLSNYPEIYDFLHEQIITGIEKLDSLWRKENLLLRISFVEGNYVFKKICDSDKESEIERFQLLSNVYPGLIPKSYFYFNDGYLMEWIDGRSFFNLWEDERIEKIRFAGITLRNIFYRSEEHTSELQSR